MILKQKAWIHFCPPPNRGPRIAKIFFELLVPLSDMFGMDVVQTEESVAENFQIIGVRVFWLVLRSIRIFGRWSNISFNSDFTSRQWLGILFYFNYFFFDSLKLLTFISLLHFFVWTRKILGEIKKKKWARFAKSPGNSHKRPWALKITTKRFVWVLHMFRSV